MHVTNKSLIDNDCILDRSTDSKLSSLLKYLDDFDYVDNKHEAEKIVEQPKLQQHASSLAPKLCENDIQRKWIWESLQTEETEEIENNYDIFNNQHSRTVTQDSFEKHGIDQKISEMQSELNEQASKIKLLQAGLFRKRASSERELHKLKDRWSERIQKQTMDHEKIVSKQKMFICQLKKDCDDMMKKKLAYKEEIKNINVSMDKTYSSAISKFNNGINQTRKSWEDAERESLKDFVNIKTQELKKNAVEALEPELLELVSRQKSTLESLRVEMVAEVEKYRTKTGQRCRNEAQLEIERINRQNQKREEGFQKKQSIYLSELTNQHMDELQQIRSKWKENIAVDQEKFEIEKKKQSIEHSREIEDIKKSGKTVYDQLLNTHKAELKAVEEEQQNLLKQKKQDYEELTKTWRIESENQMKRKFASEQQLSAKKIQEESKNEFDIIAKRLLSEVVDKKASSTVDYENRLKNVQDSNEQELKVLADEEDVARNVYDEKLQHHKNLENDVSNLSSRVMALQEEVQYMEKSINEEHNKLEKIESERIVSIKKLNSDMDEKLASEKSHLHSLHKEVQNLMKTLNMDHMRKIEEVTQVKLRQKASLDDVNERVTNLLATKQKVIEDTYEKLQNMRYEEQILQLKIDEERAKKVLR